MGISHIVEVRAEEGMPLLQFLWMISFGRYIHCIAAPDVAVQNLNHGSLPLNPLAFFQAVADAIINERYAASVQYCRMTEVPFCLEEAVSIPLEIWEVFAVQISGFDTEIDTSLQVGCDSFHQVNDISVADASYELSEIPTIKPRNVYF